MRIHQEGAAAPGSVAPDATKSHALKDETPGWQAEGFRDQSKPDRLNSACTPHGWQAPTVIDGEFPTLRAVGDLLRRIGGANA
jgi:hypothetical protein